MIKESLNDALRDLIDQYDNDIEKTVYDVIDESERLAEEYGDTALAEAVAKIRFEQKQELMMWGIRGDLDSAEENFLEAVRDMAARKSPEILLPEKKKS